MQRNFLVTKENPWYACKRYVLLHVIFGGGGTSNSENALTLFEIDNVLFFNQILTRSILGRSKFFVQMKDHTLFQRKGCYCNNLT